MNAIRPRTYFNSSSSNNWFITVEHSLSNKKEKGKKEREEENVPPGVRKSLSRRKGSRIRTMKTIMHVSIVAVIIHAPSHAIHTHISPYLTMPCLSSICYSSFFLFDSAIRGKAVLTSLIC